MTAVLAGDNLAVSIGTSHSEAALNTPLLQASPVSSYHPTRIINYTSFQALRDTVREVVAFRPSTGATLSGIGLMVDTYDLVAMNMALNLLARRYGEQTPAQDAMMTGSVLIGAAAGQLGFGAYSDKIGRRTLTLLVSGLTLAGSLGSAVALPLNSKSPSSIYYTITAMRFVLGLGIGGEFPLSASNTVEQTSIKESSTALAYAMMLLNSGACLASGVFTVLLELNPSKDDLNWRLGLGFGAVLSAVTLALRSSLLQESPVFRMPSNPLDEHLHNRDPARNRLVDITPTSISPISSIQAKFQAGLQSPWFKPVAGAATTWFLYNISAFSIGTYSSGLLSNKNDLTATAKALLVSSVTAFPFSALSIVLINDKLLGRRNCQMLGLGGMALMLGCMAATNVMDDKNNDQKNTHNEAVQQILITACLAGFNSFDALGPGSSTFAFSSEIFPARLRGTLHGVAAAAGKLGGALGAMGFPFMKQYLGAEISLLLASGACALGSLTTKLLLPNYTNQHLYKLEEIGNTADDRTLVETLYNSDAKSNVFQTHSALEAGQDS